MVLYWTGTDSLMLVDVSKRKLRKKIIWIIFRFVIKFLDKFYIERHYVDHIRLSKNLEKFGVSSFVQKEWGSFGVPRLFERASKREKMTWDDKDHDYETFKDAYISIDNNTFFKYYNSKKVYYIQIGGGYGTYYLGQDPANLKGFTDIIKFDGTIKLRIRKKGSTISPNYRFSTALMIDSNPTKSPFDISQSDSIDFLVANLSK